jgi:hypothetical protein
MVGRGRFVRRVGRLGGATVAAALILGTIVAPGVMAARPPAGTQVVSGHTFDPTRLAPSNARPASRARAERLTSGRGKGHGPSSTGSITEVGRATQTSVAVTADMHLYTDPPFTEGTDANGAMVGSIFVMGTSGRIYATDESKPGTGFWNASDASFFKLPADEFYYGTSVTASIYRGRWVAVLPSFEDSAKSCGHGYLNVAVSTTTDPRSTWTRFRIAVTDSWTDAINIAATDDKVVLTTNQWDLDINQVDCQSGTYEGAHIRVVDWVDLLDGGTLTVKDVTPPSSTSYFNWVPASKPAGTTSTSAGTPAYLAGDKFVSGTWGHFVFGGITGSAKAGTAALVRNEELTTGGAIPLLTPPPPTIAAFPSGNGFQDERVVSAVWQGSHLWASTTTSCKLVADTALRSCARYIELNTATAPATVLEDALVTDLARDTFLPLVGMSRDGGAYFAMSASSATSQQPIDEYATYRASGQSLAAGPAEEKIWPGDDVLTATYLGTMGSVAVDPHDNRAIWAIYTARWQHSPDASLLTHIKGGESDAPSGTIALGSGSGWTMNYYDGVFLYPSTTSPIQTVRYSVSPDTEQLTGGPHLINGKDSPSISYIGFNAEDATIGGTANPGQVTVYVQWETPDGTWSTPISATDQIDSVAPTVSPLRISFNLGTVGTTVSVRASWTASDGQSGLQDFVTWAYRLSPSPSYPPVTTLSASATSISRWLTVGGKWQFGLQAIDRAGNGAAAPTIQQILSAIQSSTSFIYHGTWATSTSSSYLGGSTRYATSLGAYVSYTFTGRAIAFVSTKASNRGRYEVYIDGVKVATLDDYSSTTKYRQVVYQTSWPATGTHTIKIRVLGTSGRARVDFDGFLKT